MTDGLSEGRIARILEFERQIFVAQSADVRGGFLGDRYRSGFGGL
ncbi:MAG TPA: hypothetical protein VG273_23300 [Bryobacteraceae bacterium]|jgi:hypothetical protein|nr:hypothetical protein [Bryobacteraceae bacterium]